MNCSVIFECSTSKELFELWQQAHKNEKGNETIPKVHGNALISKNNFIADGCLDLKNEKAKYLYVLKESNQEKQLDCGDCIHYGALDWRRSNEASARRQNGKMIKLFSVLEEKEISTSDLAVININKRGGYNHCDEVALSSYGRVYKDFIKQQIEIIAPSKVICANTVFEILADIYGASNTGNIFKYNEITFYKWYHPAARKPYSEFLQRFK